jgi:hypothetical protein
VNGRSQRGLVDNGLTRAVFDALPPEVHGYLTALSDALRAHDEGFLLAQGEASFTNWASQNLDDSLEFLACLLRTGDLAAEVGFATREKLRLDLR